MDLKILEYQKLDKKLLALEKELSSNEAKKQVQNMVVVVKDAQNKILELEEQAKRLLQELDKLKNVQEKGINLVEKYVNQDISSLSNEELKELDTKTMQVAHQLSELDNRIVAHNAEVKKVVFEFDSLKKKAMNARQKHKECKEEYDKIVSEKEPQIKKIKAEMQAQEKSLSPAVLSKYKTLRQDGIFPVLVPLQDKRCGACRMEQSSVALDKLKDKGVSECEHCRRLIYIEK